MGFWVGSGAWGGGFRWFEPLVLVENYGFSGLGLVRLICSGSWYRARAFTGREPVGLDIKPSDFTLAFSYEDRMNHGADLFDFTNFASYVVRPWSRGYFLAAF